MTDNFKWIDGDKLSIIDDENNPEYWCLDEYIEKNLDSLLNHKLENIRIEELCEHILNKYQSDIENEIEYHIEKFYSYIFRFIYFPQDQNYFLKLEISMESNLIENFLKCDNAKDFIIEKSNYYINKFKSYYKDGFGIKKFYDIPTADNLAKTYSEDIIEKYMVDPNIIY